MTETDVDWSVLDKLDFDAGVPCMSKECHVQATWAGNLKCCGREVTHCDEHTASIREALFNLSWLGVYTTCLYCGSQNRLEEDTIGNWRKL